jgi:1-phosphofructokinase family hexose kinase
VIITVTPNGSVDLVLRAVGPPNDEEQEVIPVAETAGGKGHNVARFLAAAGHDVTALGFAGGPVGERLAELLRVAGVATALTAIEETTRRYTTVLGAAPARVSYHMAGPTVTQVECRRLTAAVAAAAPDARLIILAGSLPPGAPADLWATIIDAAGGRPVILDTSGPALAAGVGAAPWMVKVNRAELTALDVVPPESSAARATWSDALRSLADRTGIRRWWVTLGAAGAIGWVDGKVIRTPGARVRVVNTTGAGDAFFAGWLDAHLRGASDEVAASRATAWAAAVCEQDAPIAPPAARIDALGGALTGPDAP